MDRLRHLMKDNSISNYRLAKILGVSEGTIRAWKKGTSIPKGKNLTKLSEYFGVHPAWLLYGDEVNIQKNKKIDKVCESRSPYGNDIDTKILMLLKDLSIEDKREILRHLEEKKLLKELQREVQEIKRRYKAGND